MPELYIGYYRPTEDTELAAGVAVLRTRDTAGAGIPVLGLLDEDPDPAGAALTVAWEDGTTSAVRAAELTALTSCARYAPCALPVQVTEGNL